MKKLLLTLIVAMLANVAAFAQDYPALQIDEVFTVKNFGDEVWTFTAPKDGIAKIVGDNGDGEWIGSCLIVYDNAEMTHEVQSYNYTYYEFTAKAQHTYYIKNWNWSGQDYRAKVVMGADKFELLSTDPADGAKFYITSDNHATLTFSSNVAFTSYVPANDAEGTDIDLSVGTLTIGANVVKIYNFTDYNALVKRGIFTYTEEGASGIVDWNGAICAREEGNNIVIAFTSATGRGYFNVVNRLVEEGKIQAGDAITLNMRGIKSSGTGALLDGTGDVTLNWTFAGAPTTLKAHSVPATILSWYNAGDPAGVATFTFSRPISKAQASLEMGQGEGADDLYTEEIAPDHIILDGCDVKVDLSGVMRTRSTMGLKNNWSSFTVTVYGVVDEEGNSAFSEDLGSASSYHFTAGYKDITATVASDITPASGSTLTADNKSVEIWFNNSDVIEYDGVSILYYTMEQVPELDNEGNDVMTEQNVAHEVLVPLAELTVARSGDETTIVCPLPEGVHEAQNVRVALNVTKSNDGNAHNIVAYYNTTLSYDLDILRTAMPANESTVNRLAEISLTLGHTYAIKPNVKVNVQGRTNPLFTTTATIVSDGMTNVKLVLAQPITEAGSYAVVIPQGAVGDYIYGESNYQTGITNVETTLVYAVSGLWDGRDVIATPDDGETVPALATIKLNFVAYSAVAPSWNVEKPAYVEEVISEDETIVHSGQFVEYDPLAEPNELTFVLDTPITAAGTYRLVVPAGSVANGANGNPLTTDYTFTYTVEPAAVADKPVVTPAEGEVDELEFFTINFGQPVELNMVTQMWGDEIYESLAAQPYVAYEDAWGEMSIGGEVVPGFNEGEINFILYERFIKNRDVKLVIPAGMVKFADGTTNAEYTYSYHVSGFLNVELNIVSTTPEQWSEVETLSEMTITFDQPVGICEWGGIALANDEMWDFNNVAEGTIQPTDDPCTVKIVFPEPLEGFGLTIISIYGGTFIDATGRYYQEEIMLNLTVGEYKAPEYNNDPVEDENITVVPSHESVVASLKYFEITFGGYLGAWVEQPIRLLDQFDNVVAEVATLDICNQEGIFFFELGMPNTYSITLPEEVTTPGFYYLTVPALCEKPDGGITLREQLFFFEVDPTVGVTAIKAVPANGIYTIDGMRVNNIVRPGIYIIDGKKVMVRK